MTRKKIQLLYVVLGEMLPYGGIALRYFVVKNRKLLEPEAEAIREAGKTPQAYTDSEYEKQRIALCEKYCEKSEKGRPLTKNKQYVLTVENSKLLDKALNELQLGADYKKAADILIEHEEQLRKFLNQDTEIPELHRIKETDLPAGVTGRQMEIIWDLIDAAVTEII